MTGFVSSAKILNATVLLSPPQLVPGALCDLVAFVQFKKHEKHPWRSVNFSKVAGLNLQLY